MTIVVPALRSATSPASWTKNELWRKAATTPSLDLRFAETKSLVDATTGSSLVTFTRASSGTYVGSDGLIKTAGVNVPRFDHNPVTGESLGLLVEEQRTNLVTNNTMVGAATGTPGTLPTGWGSIGGATGLASEIVAIGTDRGVSYIDFRFTGTTGNNFLTVVFLTGTIGYITNTSYSGSLYAKLVGGVAPAGFAPNVRIRYNLSPSGSTDIIQNFAMPSSGTPITECRQTATGTTTGTLTGTGLFFLQLNYNSGQVVDFTIRIGLPQLEQGAFATSVIPTTSSTVTRAADVASISGSNFSGWYRQDEGTVFARSAFIGDNGLNQFLYSISDGAIGDEIRLFKTPGTTSCTYGVESSASGTTYNVFSDNLSAFGAEFRSAFAFATNNVNRAVSGSLGTTDTSASLPVVNQINIGARMNATFLANARIKRLTYWAQRLPDATLQTITQ